MIKTLTSFRRDLYLIFALSLMTILFIELFLNKIPEFFSGGELIGTIVLKLCYSIMASVIFYFFAIHLKESRKRNQISDLLSAYLQKMIALKNGWMSELYFIACFHSKGEVDWPKNQGATITNFYPTEKEIEKLAKFTPLHETRSKEKNWIERIDKLQIEIQILCKSILVLDNNLKANEIRLIGELSTCDLFTKISFYKSKHDSNEIANDNISFIKSELKSFFNLVEKIEKQVISKL